MKKLTILCIALLPLIGSAQINVNKIKNKAKGTLNTNKNSGSTSTEKSSSETENKTTETTKTTNSTSTNTGANSGTNTANSSGLPAAANFYDGMRQFIDRNLSNIGNRDWSHDFMDDIETADIPRLEQRMKDDAEVAGDFLMLYPKKLPTSGMGTITQQNVNEFTFANVADPSAEPPASEEGKKIMKFYIEYCLFKYDLISNNKNVANMINRSIQEADNAHIKQKLDLAIKAKRQGELAFMLMPDDMRIEELKDEAVANYNTTLDGFGMMISGPYHREHIQGIKVLKAKPNFGSETATDELETIVPGEPAYITGYFAMTNKDAGGIPSLLFISPENQYAKDKNPWGHGVEAIASMFNGQNVKDEFRDKAYFTFNLFPDLNTVSYESHVQYIPHLNIIKYLMYLPSGIHEIPVRFGRMQSVATGRIKIDLSGDNRAKLKEYFKALDEKRLAAVRFPDFAGCEDERSKVTNFSDLSKYGEVLLMTLTKTGDIMKPWPNDDEVDFNTAEGYASVKKSDGRIEVMPLEFRKRPTESMWQWWSVGKFPGLFPMHDQDNAIEINAVKKVEHGYEILPENAKKCGYWYDRH